MTSIDNDSEYQQIVGDILSNDRFSDMSKIKHHCSNRYNHSLKVSYYSYRIAKLLKLDYSDTARGGLLHDFYFERTTDYKKPVDKIKLYTTNHPMQAVNNSKEFFGITTKEEDIIKSHMFPLDYKVPTYSESWIVNVVDTAVSSFEFCVKFKYQLGYIANLYLILLFNSIK